MEPDHASSRVRSARQRQSALRIRRHPGAGRAVLAAALVLGTASGVVHAPAAVGQDAAGQDAAAVESGDISGLIRAVADATAELDATREEIAVKRDEVNKTLVDLQMARVELDRAIEAADRTAADRENAEEEVESARGTLEDYSRLLYRQGTAPGAASALLDPGGPGEAGTRQEYLQRAAADQRLVVDDMVAAADEAARREAEATSTRDEAELRYTDASARRDQAQTQVSAVSDQIAALETEVSELTSALDQKESALADSRTAPEGPDAPESAGAAPVDEEQARAQAEQALAETPEARQQAADIASALPTHLDLGDIRQFTGGSSDRAGQALGAIDGGSVGDALDGTIDAGSIGDAVDTGSVGGAVDAGSVGDAVSAGIRGDQDAIIQQVVDAIGRADMGSLQQGPGTPGTPGTGGDTGTPSDSAQVETVVNRALSQLGVPYAWGGGDANGPTRGIRDGGVADQHGDYNKIGFDCSGLMIYAFAGVGKALPHYTGYQYQAGPQYPVNQRKRGDMLFWPGHVALYLGDGLMVEAPQSGDVVKISPVRMAGISPMVVRLI